jgi:hypothetical protein
MFPAGNSNSPATQSASADANTLDDYEEGTWTPTDLAVGQSQLSLQVDTATGLYLKQGGDNMGAAFVNVAAIANNTEVVGSTLYSV